jgi:sulfotransferase
MKAIHFISGMPRSGSTLLSALLRQNPAFHANVSSPVLSLVNAVVSTLGSGQEWASLTTDDQRASTLRALVAGYYQHLAGKVVFDTSRGWCGRMPLLARLYPEAKVIVCLREYGWAIDSFERLVRNNPLMASKLFTFDNSATVYSRADQLAAQNGTVGFAWAAAREAIFGEHKSRLIVLDYEALAREPAQTMEFLYQALALPPFKHDFDNVVFDSDEFDAQIGMPGMHTVQRKVDYVERDTVLPPDLFYRFRQNDYWKAPEFTRSGIPNRIKPRTT